MARSSYPAPPFRRQAGVPDDYAIAIVVNAIVEVAIEARYFIPVFGSALLP
jgi:hypothetical protein